MSLKEVDAAEKPEIHEAEYAPKTTKDLEWANRDDIQDVDQRSGVLGYFLKKNPSPEFIADLATMNNTVLDPKEVARIERKIDWSVCYTRQSPLRLIQEARLIIPALSVCYMFYYVDKTTLSYAAIFNIKKGLNLGKSEYASRHNLPVCQSLTSPQNWLSSLFYFGWLGWALPTNLLMQKYPLNKYLAFNIFLWGALLMAQAASRNFTDLAILRTLSGAFEATADPAFVLITSTWYTREQQPTRIGYWYCANGIGIALGGILGFGIGITPLVCIKGLPSWKYEFLIVGALCCAWAIFMFIFIPDSPYQTHWFTRAERLIIVSRKRNDQNGPDNRHWDASQAIEGFVDIKTYLFFLFGFTANVPNGGTSNFGTLIIQGFGFNTLNTTLMQLPYGAIIVAFIVVALIVNKRLPPGNRTYLMVATNIPTVIGFALVAWAKGKGARLFGYWITGASNATFVVGLSLVSGNVGGQTKKAIASAAVFLGVAAGNIVGPFLFKDSEAPTYITGVVGCMVSRILEIVVILALRVVFSRANAKRDRDVTEGRVQYDDRVTALQDISDWKNPAFRYVLRCSIHDA
ncbi:MFS general substrate transporter [Mycena metata]|uniref:MFS general substrate transporter n=1 Tax=Mycena metata TaxID=1033252 RepID=A0AAD7N2M6_9AGAR|nr:MFS general substrate transporter [Mycena metata]